MIKYLAFKNFRAFDRGSFDFSRINVFVGPNNSGKSSIISALNLIAQTVRENEVGVPLVLRGSFEDLGTFVDVVHRNDSRRRLSLEISIGRFTMGLEFRYRSQRREIEITKFDLLDEYNPVYSFAARKDAYEIRYFGRTFESVLGGVTKRRPEFRGLYPTDRNLFNLARYTRHSKEEERTALPYDLLRKLENVDRNLRRANYDITQTFRNFDSLSPFREPPKRTYVFSGVTPASVGRTGANSIDILVSDSFKRGTLRRGILEGVSSWLRATGMARSINVRPLTPRHFEICVTANDGTEHNLSDVGFGCSQVLPVLVGGLNLFLAGRDSHRRFFPPIYIVQEPEIHLHPNAQAELATFFVHLTRTTGGQLFIETHSDNLVLRLQRHVALQDIDHKDVRLFFVWEIDGERRVQPMELDQAGIFRTEWPGGFFPQRQRESFELARAATKDARNEEIDDRPGTQYKFLERE